MVRLPSRDDLGPLPSANPGGVRATAQRGVADTARFIEAGTKGLGAGLDALGASQQVRAELEARAAVKESEYESEYAVQEFIASEEERLDQKMQGAQPHEISNFADTYQAEYRERAKGVFENIPDNLKRKYEAKLFQGETALRSSSAKFAIKAAEDISVARWTKLNNININRARVATNEGELNAISSAQNDALNSSNISLGKRLKMGPEGEEKLAIAMMETKPIPEGNKLLKGKSYLNAVIGSESNFNSKARPRVRDKTGKLVLASSAGGRSQFLASTWLEEVKENTNLANTMTDEQILALRFSDKPEHVALDKAMNLAFAKKNSSALVRMGHDATNANIHMAHVLGAGGASAVLNSDPAMLVSKVLSPEVIKANKRLLKGKTGDQVMAFFEAKQNGTRPLAFESLTEAGRAQSILNQNRMLARNAQQLKLAQTAQDNTFLNRWQPGHQDGPPSIKEINDSVMTPTRKEHHLEMARSGGPKVGTNSNTHREIANDIISGVINPENFNEKVFPFVNRGIDFAAYTGLKTFMEDSLKQDTAGLKEFFARWHKQISRTTMVQADGIGELNFLRFQQEVLDTIAQNRRLPAKDRVPMTDLLNREHPKSLWKIGMKYPRTVQEAISDQIKATGPRGGPNPVVTSEPAKASVLPSSDPKARKMVPDGKSGQRKETGPEYWKRLTGNK